MHITGKRNRKTTGPRTQAKKRRVNRETRMLKQKAKPIVDCMDDSEMLQERACQLRLVRVSETEMRNNRNQQNILNMKAFAKKVKSKKRQFTIAEMQERDRQDFYSRIDEPMTFICGSCGELAYARKTCIQTFSRDNPLFKVLRLHEEGDIMEGVVKEAIVRNTKTGLFSVPFCEACMKCLRRRTKPKYCEASGFRICAVPAELRVLNTVEARMIGLGISFTTCYKLPGDGQEATKGNAINFWNDACKIAAKLPRPISKCGVIRMKCKGDKDSSRMYEVRPNLIRIALLWLRKNNPLYKRVEISEDTLRGLEFEQNIPTIDVDEEDFTASGESNPNKISPDTTSKLHTEGECNQNAKASTNLCDDSSYQNGNTGKPHESNCNETRDILSTAETDMNGGEFQHKNTDYSGSDKVQCGLETISQSVELFQMPVGEHSSRTESENILESLNVQVDALCDPMNEYETKTVMQCCFPTLFPDGKGGLNPIDGELRSYTYELADFCAHLMAWHDRRFVIHRNFKFFCFNLIQRRRIDGLTRRISHREDGNTATSSTDPTETNERSNDRMRQVLKELKPFFRVVRGSGLYWSNVRDELMAMIGDEVMTTPFPTFFFTLSAADTIWPDFFRACDSSLTIEQATHLPAAERRRLLNENPDIASRHFYRRFKAFFDCIICGDAQPLGEVTDYFWRVEFQKRGSPHVHGLLWVKDAPDVLKLSETETGREVLAAFLDRFVSASSYSNCGLSNCQCKVCTEQEAEGSPDILSKRQSIAMTDQERACDLARVVRRVQQHACFEGWSCRAKTGACRFGFPKPLRDKSAIIVEKANNGALRLNVECYRDDSQTNNYNKDLLSVWRANMDIKLIGNAYGAAEYTSAYVCKSEPETAVFRELINRALDKCEDNMEHHSMLRRVANATLAGREVSAQEALWIVQHGLPMYGKSRRVIRVKSTRHSMRYYRVDPKSVRKQILLGKEDDSLQVRVTSYEAAYMARPDTPQFANMSFKTFCERFSLTEDSSEKDARLERWKRSDSNGYIRARRCAQVVAKIPRWRPDKDSPDYCFSELLLYMPWRSLNDLPDNDSECISKFEEFRQSLSATQQERISSKLVRAEQLELLSQPEADTSDLVSSDVNVDGRDDEPENFQNCNHADLDTLGKPAYLKTALPIKSRFDYSDDDINRAESFVEKVVKPFMNEKRASESHPSMSSGHQASKQYQYPIGLDGENMKQDQWIAFALCMRQSRARRACIESGDQCQPLSMILNGEGGCGKSWLIHHIVRDIHHVFDEDNIPTRYSKRVLLLAHHGTAAFNIKGKTICSALAIGRSAGQSYERPYQPLTQTTSGSNKLRKLQEAYRSVHMVIVDEYSVISSAMLHWMDMRMREIWPEFRDVPFGGRDIILAGDLGQLSPVMPAALSTPLEELCGSNQLNQRLGRRLWSSITNVCNLTCQNRGSNDPDWYNALRRLRRMEQTSEDMNLFNSRHVSQLSLLSNARYIAYKNEDVDEANNKLVRMESNLLQIFSAHHAVCVPEQNCNDDNAKLKEMESLILAEASLPNQKRDRIVAPLLSLAIGSPVALTFNMVQSAGLCNGTSATVYDFMPPRKGQVPVVLVEIKDKYIGPSFLPHVPNIVPIAPRTISWSSGRSKMTTQRTGIPLRLAYAMTIHKVQGLTCPAITFDPTGIPSSAFAYVALSRVRTRADITLTRVLDIKEHAMQRKLKKRLTQEWNRLDELSKNGSRRNSELVSRCQSVAELENSASL